MSKSANHAPTPGGSVVQNTAGKGSKQMPDGPHGFMSDDKLREFFDKHYNQLLPIMAEKDPETSHVVGIQAIRGTQVPGEPPEIQTKEERGQDPHPKLQSENSQEGHWNSMPKKLKSSTDEDDLSQPWLYEETDPFTPQIHNFVIPKRVRMPSNIKIYDGAGDRIGMAKAPETDGENQNPNRLETFLAYFLQQKKYINDPIEIHHIKQRGGESIEAFMKHFKAESLQVKGALKCLRIFGFMHCITNPNLIKRLNDNILKLVDKMMNVTTAFLRGEVAVANQSRKKTDPP
ncbi:hypothetical protein Tco_1070987 [Tanacetum coccineum]|uniref:Reverse transcriptase domain-containing protein n=1 Tax=Tanacetum coccineum TaxID=301880 RepID=A0ABQ5HMZ9_9ASTR